MFKYILFLIYILISVTGMALIKSGGTASSLSLREGMLGLSVNIKYLIGMATYATSFMLYLIVLPRFDLSIFGPMAGSSIIVLSVLAGALIFGEKLDFWHILGVVLIIGGIFLINFKR